MACREEDRWGEGTGCMRVQGTWRTERRTDGASAEGGGRCFERVESGCAKLTKRKRAAVARPLAVAWVSDMRKPRWCSTERAYAEMRQLRERILNIWVVVTRVHLCSTRCAGKAW